MLTLDIDLKVNNNLCVYDNIKSHCEDVCNPSNVHMLAFIIIYVFAFDRWSWC